MSALLILAASIIGFSTAWLYYKSVYVKRIKAMEAEKAKMKCQIIKFRGMYTHIIKMISDSSDEDHNEILKMSPGSTGNIIWFDQSGVLAKKQLFQAMS